MIREEDLDTTEGLVAFYELCLSKKACEPPMIITMKAIEDGWTLRQLIDQTIDQPEYSDWARWLRIGLAKYLPRSLRNQLTHHGVEDRNWVDILLNSGTNLSIAEKSLLNNLGDESWQ